MAGLISGYGSSDDESTPTASTSKGTLPKLGGSTQTLQVNDEEDEDESVLQEMARSDAFGLTNGGSNGETKRSESKAVVMAAPDVLKEDPNGAGGAIIARSTDKVMNVNISYEDMQRPVAGPLDPFDARKNKGMNSLSGHVEEDAIDDHTFVMQQRTYDVKGYALNPNATSFGDSPIVGSASAAHENGYLSIENIRPSKAVRRETKRKREGRGDASVVDGEGAYLGPWAGFEQDKEIVEEFEEAEEDAAEWREEKRRREEATAAAKAKMTEAREEKSTLHAKEATDYQGRSYLHIPTDLDVNLRGGPETQPKCFVPQRCVHTWTGHNKGVSSIKLFPVSGHLLLSGSMDTKVKLWDVHKDGAVLRTFQGHSQAVKDVAFNGKGTHFLSSAFDRTIKAWDTESGKCVSRFSNGAVANFVMYHPDPDKQNLWLAGLSNKTIIEYDTRAREIVQTYDSHLGSVSSLAFYDNNHSFVSSSEDKSIKGWNHMIPVPISYISDPSYHHMPDVKLHPDKKYLAFQSLDNQILVWSAQGLKAARKKTLRGHNVAGYACKIAFSPDGQFLSSGTGGGEVVIWNWKTQRIEHRFRGHEQPVIDHIWAPHHRSHLITASWDGTIKLWI